MYPPQDREGSFTISSRPPKEEPLDFRPSGGGGETGIGEDTLDFKPDTPITPPPISTPAQPTASPPEDKSLIEKGWELGHTPLWTGPQRGAKAVSDWMTEPRLNEMPTGDNSWSDWLKTQQARATGFGAGGLEGIGNTLTQMTAPFDLAATIGTAGSGFAAKRGLGTLAEGLMLAGRAGAAPMAAHGAVNVLHPESTLSERGQGLAEMGMGLAGTFQPGPKTAGPKLPEIAESVAQPEGLTSPELFSPNEPSPPSAPPPSAPIPEDYPTQSVDLNKLSDALAADMVPNPPTPAQRSIAQGVSGVPTGQVHPEIARAMRAQLPDAELPPAVEWKPSSNEPSIEFIEDSGVQNNASGESGASMEAISRLKGMASKGERFVVYDRSGKARPLLGADAVDYVARPGETYGIESPQGFKTLDAKGGRVPSTEKMGTSMEMPQATSPDTPSPLPGESLVQFQRRNRISFREAKRIMDEFKAGGGGGGGGGGKVPPNEPPVTTGGEPPSPTPKRVVKNATPAKVKEMLERGYELTDVKNGEFEFTYTGKKTSQPMLEEEVPQRVARRPPKEKIEPGVIRKTIDMMRANQSVDPPFVTSAAFRQAAPHMWTKKWFQAWKKAAYAYGDEAVYQAQQKMIQEHPLFRPRPPKQGSTKPEPSFAQEIGMRMTDAESYMVSRHEGLRAGWSEKIPVFGSHIKGSNRAFAAFLNHIRVKLLEEFVANGEAQAAAHGNSSLNLKNNIPLAKEFAGVINDTTGSGELATKLGFKWKGKEISTGNKINLEKHINLAADVLYSPRLMARNIRMLNPSTYLLANPAVRKEYLKAMLRSMSSWAALATAAKMAGAEVSVDPRSTDFGKIKIGNLRLDPGQGFQQYLTFFAKEAAGSYTSSIEKHGKYKNFPLGGTGVNPQTRYTVAQTFLSNKMSPAAKFFFDVARASKHEPVYLTDRTAQLFIPMMTGDLVDIVKDDPSLAGILNAGAVGVWSGVGGGAQTYSGEVETTKFVPSDWDIKLEGGGFF